MRVSPLLKNTVGTIANDVPDDVLIDVLTIHDLLGGFNLNDRDIVLKMYCEGREYDVLPTISKQYFNKINEIFIKHHNKLNSLKDILDQNGYITKVIPKGRKMGLLIGKR